MRRIAFLLVFVFMSAVLPPAGSEARDRGQDRAREAVDRGQIRPLNEILSGVHARYPGRVVDIHLDQESGRWTYRIKILRRDGRVLAVSIDATSNRILSVRGGRR